MKKLLLLLIIPFLSFGQIQVDTILTLENIIIDNMNDDPVVSQLINAIGIEVPFPSSQEVVGSFFNLIDETLVPALDFSIQGFESASFNTGELEVAITNKFPVIIENIELEILTGDLDNGVQIPNLLQEEIGSIGISLSGIAIDNNINVNFLDLTFANVGSSMVDLNAETGVEISLSFVGDITSTSELSKLGTLIKKIDILGREATNNKGLQLHIYDDGSVEKKYLIK